MAGNMMLVLRLVAISKYIRLKIRLTATLGTASPTAFKPGGYSYAHIVGNYDISKAITDNISLAFGAEVRSETYKIIAGDTASYSGEGANSFPGIRAGKCFY